jgi:hypothetical protein
MWNHLALAHVARAKRNKLDGNAMTCCSLGTLYESPAYELYDLEQGNFFTASSVDFIEDVSLERIWYMN